MPMPGAIPAFAPPGPWGPPPPGAPAQAWGAPAQAWGRPPLPPQPPSALSRAMADFWAAARDRASGRALGGIAVVGLAGGVLVVGHRPGLGLALVLAALWLPAVPALVRRHAIGSLLLVGAAVALAGVVAVRDAPWLVALCVLGCLGAGAVAVTDARSVPALLAVPVSAVAGLARALPWAARGVSGRVSGRRGQALAAIRSAAITVVLLGVFGALLASADALVGAYLTGIDLDLAPARIAVGVLVAAVAAAAAHLALAPPGWGALRPRAPRPAALGEWLVPVGALAALVLAFIGLQISALAGGHRHVLESVGLSYAEYARQGFGQLMVVTVLTLVVVAVAARRAPRETQRERIATAAALAALCVGTLGVVASALLRMSLYVDAFGLTRLRIFVLAVEAALGVVLLLVMAAGLRWRGQWLPRAVVGVAAVALLALSVSNPDALIVRVNVAADEANDLVVPLDVHYLRGLSDDAVPTAATLDDPLRSCLLDGRRMSESTGIAGWNLGRQQATEALERAETEPGECVWAADW